MNESKIKVNILRSWQESKGFYILTFLTFSALLSYLLFTSATIFNLVAEKNIETQKHIISTEISNLEAEALALNDTISIKRAYELGFVSAKEVDYVKTKAVVTLR